MKKKIFIGLAMSLFAVATVFNMNISEQASSNDVSLDGIEVMVKAEAEYPGGWSCRFSDILLECIWTSHVGSQCPSWAC